MSNDSIKGKTMYDCSLAIIFSTTQAFSLKKLAQFFKLQSLFIMAIESHSPLIMPEV